MWHTIWHTLKLWHTCLKKKSWENVGCKVDIVLEQAILGDWSKQVSVCLKYDLAGMLCMFWLGMSCLSEGYDLLRTVLSAGNACIPSFTTATLEWLSPRWFLFIYSANCWFSAVLFWHCVTLYRNWPSFSSLMPKYLSSTNCWYTKYTETMQTLGLSRTLVNLSYLIFSSHSLCNYFS